MMDFPERPFPNHYHHPLHHEKLTNSAQNYPPLLVSSLDLHQLLPVHEVELAQLTSEGVDRVGHFDLVNLTRIYRLDSRVESHH